jgi:hypothetical protein
MSESADETALVPIVHNTGTTAVGLKHTIAGDYDAEPKLENRPATTCFLDRVRGSTLP